MGGVPQMMGKQIIFKKNPMKGFPDLAGVCKDGVLWALELKSSKGRLSPEQTDWLQKLSKSGAIVGVAKTPQEAVDFFSIILARSAFHGNILNHHVGHSDSSGTAGSDSNSSPDNRPNQRLTGRRARSSNSAAKKRTAQSASKEGCKRFGSNRAGIFA